MVYAHGGGMIAGNLDAYDAVIAQYVAATEVPLLSVDYRLAPEAQGPRPAQDVFAAAWLRDHAPELESDRIGSRSWAIVEAGASPRPRRSSRAISDSGWHARS